MAVQLLLSATAPIEISAATAAPAQDIQAFKQLSLHRFPAGAIVLMS